MLHGAMPNILDMPTRLACERKKRVAFCDFPTLPASAESVCSLCLCGSAQIQVKQRINPVSLISDILTGTITLYKSCQKPKCVLQRMSSFTHYPCLYSVRGLKKVHECIPNLGDQKSVLWRPSRNGYQCCRVVGFAVINESGEIGAMCCTSNQGRVGKSRVHLTRNWTELSWDNCSVEPFKFLPIADAERFRTAINCVYDMGFFHVGFNVMLDGVQLVPPAL